MVVWMQKATSFKNGGSLSVNGRLTFRHKLLRDLRVNYILYFMLLPVALYYILFSYVPMAGIQLAFKDYMIKRGIWGSPWIGFEHFKRFFSNYNFRSVLQNTISISLYGLAAGTITPIFFSLMINYMRNLKWKKTLQMATYLPYFISTVVMVGMLQIFLGHNGMLNVLMKLLKLDEIPLLSSARWFQSAYVWSGVWQGMGFSSVIYIAALSGVDPQTHEAAIVDGASIWRRIWHIDLVDIQPTILVLLIMGLSGIINVGYEKVLLMQNALNLSSSEVLSTYIYKVGLINNDYGYSTAAGLFNSVISVILLLLANKTSRRLVGYSLW
jgi:putative aldouronate transport system permease protein